MNIHITEVITNILVENKITFPAARDLKKTHTPRSILNKWYIVMYYIFYSLDILNGQVLFFLEVKWSYIQYYVWIL